MLLLHTLTPESQIPNMLLQISLFIMFLKRRLLKYKYFKMLLIQIISIKIVKQQLIFLGRKNTLLPISMTHSPFMLITSLLWKILSTPSPGFHIRAHRPGNFTRGQSASRDPRKDTPYCPQNLFKPA